MNSLLPSRLTRFRFALPGALLILATVASQAHPGHGAEAGGIGAGFAHPFTGVDHVLAALAIGMLAVLSRRRSVAIVFLASGMLGAFAGAKIGAFAGLETLLAVSVLAVGVAVLFHQRLARFGLLTSVALVAAIHGWAHGSEAAGGMNLAGIFAGTAALVALGAIGAGALRTTPRFTAALGAGIAAAAVALLAGIL